MKRLMLVAAAGCLALTFPALAQNNANGSSQSKSDRQHSQTIGSSSQMGKQSQRQNSDQMQASNDQQQAIKPSSLSRKEIREIQSSLDKSGFNAKRADGIWGRETEHALRDFQQAKHLPGNGRLDQQTLSALDVTIGNQTQSASTNQNRQQNASSSQTGQQGQSQTVWQAQSKASLPQGTGQSTKNK